MNPSPSPSGIKQSSRDLTSLMDHDWPEKPCSSQRYDLLGDANVWIDAYAAGHLMQASYSCDWLAVTSIFGGICSRWGIIPFHLLLASQYERVTASDFASDGCQASVRHACWGRLAGKHAEAITSVHIWLVYQSSHSGKWGRPAGLKAILSQAYGNMILVRQLHSGVHDALFATATRSR